MGEVWKEVPDFHGYQISNKGRVKNQYGRLLKGNRMKDGRKAVRPTPWDHRLISHLVLEAFVGPCPEGLEACHNDGDCTNDQVDNLRWDTHASNMQDTINRGTHSQAGKTHCIRGHKLPPPDSGGQRRCKVCKNIRARGR